MDLAEVDHQMLPRPKGSRPLRYRGFGRRSLPPYV